MRAALLRVQEPCKLLRGDCIGNRGGHGPKLRYDPRRGGGCQDRFLNRLLTETTGKEVYAGPVEATAIGNLMAQMLRDKLFEDLKEARQVVAKSFDVKRIEVDIE